MANSIELCIRDKDGYIVAWCSGYSEVELQELINQHISEGWHRSQATDTGNGYF